jgi:hypothetical protein
MVTRAFVGTGFGDRFEVFRGGSGCLKERVSLANELAELQGKRDSKRWFPHRVDTGRILHGKEAVPGSSPGEGLNTCKSALFQTTEPLSMKEGLAGRVGPRSENSLQIGCLSD